MIAIEVISEVEFQGVLRALRREWRTADPEPLPDITIMWIEQPPDAPAS